MNKKAATVKLKSGHDRRVRNGFAWIFSNEIAGSLKAYEPGSIVEVMDANGYYVGAGYINPHALISVRMLTWQQEPIDASWLDRRLKTAWERRKPYYETTSAYRLVFGESDGLPGLVVDRYGEFLVVQSTTLGMDLLLPGVFECLKERCSPSAIVLRQDSQARKLENLTLGQSVVHGHLPERVEVAISGLRYRLDLLNGQKTGFFLDQKENQYFARRFAQGKRVLDCFTHLGGWALNAAQAGASEVIGLDISEPAITDARENASLNGQSISFKKADVFDELKRINDARETFDMIVLDPPAFAKGRSQATEAIKGYREINRRAAKALSPGGILITCSCSQAVDPETFRNTVSQGILSAGRRALLIESLTQPPDHPILLTMRETEYLKCLILEIH